MVPYLQKEAPVQAKRSIETVYHQPAGALPVAAKIGAGKGKRSTVSTYDGTNPGDTSRYGVTDNV